ncbi:MAG: efflux RND transporter periplasmic adaptor subunit, partial [candidate division Zixibacteria bacterium]|nr:efflux RND transporter periplasmic adaptor subunit [candidate division Zixibacteria bacterium]
ISSPRVRGNLLITKLIPEGTIVEKGDTIMEFDKLELQRNLVDYQASLKIAQANLLKAQGESDLTKKQLQLELDQAEREAKEKQFEAPLIKQEAEKKLELARLKYETNIKSMESDIQKLKIEVDKARYEVDRAQDYLSQLTVTAPIPGLVVYLEYWKGGQWGKVQEGDSPWPGQGLINLPDLSVMLTKARVHEVDIDKVKLGQNVNIILESYPETTFTGKVDKIARLATRDAEDNSNINTFDIEIMIDRTDERLKPGMSAKCEIIVDKIPNSIWVPIEAVFEKDNKTVVYVIKGNNFRERQIKVGQRNDTDIIVTEGLKGKEKVALRDPTSKEEAGAIKAKEK